MALRFQLLVASIALIGTAPAMAQTVTSGIAPGSGTIPSVQTPPSVDNGVANGVVKHAGAPSVGNGVANGVVKPAGAPSVGNGVANGVMKSTTVNQ